MNAAPGIATPGDSRTGDSGLDDSGLGNSSPGSLAPGESKPAAQPAAPPASRRPPAPPTFPPADASYFRARLGADGRVTADGAHTALFGHKLPDSALGRPDGVYAGWRWDGARLTVENDRYGFYPLFYCALPDRLLVSPSLPRLLALGAPAEFDEDGLAVFLRLGFFLGEDTPFKHIKTLPPDCIFTWEAGRLAVSGRYAFGRAGAGIGYREALEGYVWHFREAIARRLPAPGERLAVPISGGRDSRHILLELLHQGVTPEVCVTARNYPPRADHDARIAALLCAELGLRHTLLAQTESRVSAEARKNRPTQFCADEHAQFMVVADHLLAAGATVHDGIAGDMLTTHLYWKGLQLKLFRSGDARYIAAQLIAHPKAEPGFREAALRRVLRPQVYARFDHERALARLVPEIEAHARDPLPSDSFYFWNRTRREIALQPYGLLAPLKVHAPYLDHALYDYLTSLPEDVRTSASFHADAIRLGYPRVAHVEFEDKRAPGVETFERYAVYGRDLARRLLARRPSRLMGEPFLHLRLLACLASRRHAGAAMWYAPLALYLSELEALAVDP